MRTTSVAALAIWIWGMRRARIQLAFMNGADTAPRCLFADGGVDMAYKRCTPVPTYHAKWVSGGRRGAGGGGCARGSGGTLTRARRAPSSTAEVKPSGWRCGPRRGSCC